MSVQIDELQLGIGSDASDAIRQLGNLSAALNVAARSARGLAGATGFLGSFGNSLSRISSINLTKTIENLDKLSRIDLSNLKDKTIHLDFVVSGADKVDRLTVATSQASRDINRNVSAIARGVGKEFGVTAEGMSLLKEEFGALTKGIASNKDVSQSVANISKIIEEHGRKASDELKKYVKEYQDAKASIDAIGLFGGINPSGIESDEHKKWVEAGLLGALDSKSLTGIKDYLEEYSKWLPNMFDASALERSEADMFTAFREGVQSLNAAIDEFESGSANIEAIGVAAENAKEKVEELFNAARDKRMFESSDKIPINLDVDQNRFEAQIQKAITAATSRTYESTPVKLDIDTQVLRNNISRALTDIDVGQLPQFSDRFKTIADSISQMNQIRLKDTGMKEFVSALARLTSVDMTKFDSGAFSHIIAGVTELSKLGTIDKGLNRFVSAMARLANAGENTTKTADGLKVLTPELKNTVTTFQALGTMDSSINAFVTSIAQLATAGEKADKSAQGIANLTTAVKDFLNAMSNAPAINANVAQTIQGLGNLAMAGSKTGKAMNSLTSSASSTSNFFNMFKKSAETTASAFKKLLSASLSLGGKGVSAIGSFFGKLGLIPGHADNVDRMALSFGNLFRAVVPFYGLRGIFDWLKDAVTTGASIVEVENVIDTMFGTLNKGYEDLSGLVYKWADTTIDAFGVSELGARQYVGRIMAMFNSSGFDATEGMRDRAAQMSMDLVELAGDLASFYDINVDEAMTKIQAGLAGMNRPLRSLGINMSVTNLSAHALTMGITENWRSMDQATQMLVRYDYLMKAAQYASGDFAKTSQTFANQVRLLSLNFQVLSATIGQGLISAIAPAISWINALIRRLIQAANAFRTFMFTIFGKAIGAAKGVVNDLAGYADDAADSLGGVGDSGGGLGNAAKGAKELAKQLSVLPFDELNQLAKDSSAAGGGSGGGSGGGGGVGGLGDLFGDSFLDATDLDGSELADAISEWGQKIKNAFMANDWTELGDVIAEGLNRGITKLNEVLDWNNWKDKVFGFIHPFQETINSTMDSIDWPLLGETFGKGLNTITYTLDEWFKGFEWKNFGTDLATAMNSLLDEWDAAAFGQLIGDKFMVAWNFFSGWVSTFDFSDLGSKIKDVIINSMNTIDWATVGTSTADFLNGISDTLHGIFGDGEVKAKIKESFNTLLTNFFDEFKADDLGDSLVEAGSAILEGLGSALWDHKDDFAQKLRELFEDLPWGWIVGGASLVFGTSFATQLAGTALKASIYKSILGGASLGGGASAGASGAASAGTSVGASLLGGLSELSVGSLTIASGIMVGSLGLGLWLRKYAEDHGVTPETLRGQNMDYNYKSSVAEGQTKNNQQLAAQGRNAAGYNTSIQGQTKVSKAGSGESVKRNVTVTYDAKLTAPYKDGYAMLTDTTNRSATKNYNATETGDFTKRYEMFTFTQPRDVSKNYNATESGGFTVKDSNYKFTANKDVSKNYKGTETGGFSNLLVNYKFTDPRDVTKKFIGKPENDYNGLVNTYMNLPKNKDVTINLKKGSSNATWWGSVEGKIANAIGNLTGKIHWNALGGVFLGPTVMQGFGEAGPEAALPLRNQRSMSMIADAIANAGGVGTGIDTDKLANAIVQGVTEAILNSNERPINVNATLYTENNEVLARAVNRGMRSIDKRYNPVSQYSYG